MPASNRDGGRPLPAEPTDCLPATAGKVEVMRLREARGEALWHPADAQYPDAPPGVVRKGLTLEVEEGEE